MPLSATPSEGGPRAARTGLGGGAAYAVLGVGLEKAVALGIALYLPRHLGLPDFGRYALLVSYLGFFQALPDASLEAVLVTRLARTGDGSRRLAGRAALVRLTISLAGAGLGLAVLGAVTRDPELLRAGAIGAAGLAASAGSPYRVLLRSRLFMGRYLLLLAGQGALGVALLALVVRADGELAAVFAALAAAAAGGVLLGRILVGPGARLRRDAALGRALLAEAWPLAGTTATLLGAQQVLQLVLLRVAGPGAVGLLGAAQRLTDAVGLLPQAVMVSVLPALSMAAATPGGAVRGARDAARVLAIALLPLAAGLVLFAEPVLARAFGAPFAAAAPALRFLAPAAVLGGTGTVVSNLLLALGLQRVVLRTTAAAALVLLAVGAILVPTYGASGAAAAFLFAMLCGQGALLALPLTGAHVRPVLGAAVRPLALGGLVTGVAWLLGGSPVAGACVLALGYPAALVMSRTVTAADVARWRR